jgi:hypothetical protein
MERYIIGFILLIATTFAVGQSNDELPYVYFSPQPKGKTFGAAFGESNEMTKVFAKECPKAQLAEIESDADYRISLSHIEAGSFARSPQLIVTDPWGTPLKAIEGDNISTEMRSACTLILADWSDQALTRSKYLKAVNEGFRKDGIKGSAEIVGDNLVVHSERANRMRFHMLLANYKTSLLYRRAGIVTFIYTNDADQSFAYFVKSDEVNENYDVKTTGKAADTAPKSGVAVENSTVP